MRRHVGGEVQAALGLSRSVGVNDFAFQQRGFGAVGGWGVRIRICIVIARIVLPAIFGQISCDGIDDSLPPCPVRGVPRSAGSTFTRFLPRALQPFPFGVGRPKRQKRRSSGAPQG